MHRSGLYEYSGTWAAEVGYVAAKSGVAGGIIIILKGIGGLAIVSPPLDAIGNSVRGIKAGKIITKGIYNIKDAETKFCPPPPKTKKRRRTTKKRRRTTKKRRAATKKRR